MDELDQASESIIYAVLTINPNLTRDQAIQVAQRAISIASRSISSNTDFGFLGKTNDERIRIIKIALRELNLD